MYQLESAPETRTPHYQGVICFKERVRLSALKKDNPRCHWEPCIDVHASARYCSKEDTRVEGPWTFGSLTETRFKGKRNDIHNLRERVRSGASNRDLYEDDTTLAAAVRHDRAVDKMRLAYGVEKKIFFF